MIILTVYNISFLPNCFMNHNTCFSAMVGKNEIVGHGLLDDQYLIVVT